MNLGTESASGLRNREVIAQKQRQSPLWSPVHELADRIGETTAYQFAFRMLFLRIVAQQPESEDAWVWFRDRALQPYAAEIDYDLEHALRQWTGEIGADPDAWETRDYIQRPTTETQGALRGLISAVDALKGNLVEVFELALERYSRTMGDAGDYFTPRSVVRLAVNLADPRPGESIIDPACGSGGFLLAAHAHVATTGGRPLELSGRDRNRGAWQTAHLNLLAHGLRADLGEQPADSLLPSPGETSGYDVVLLNPPFNQKDWAPEAEIKARSWAFGEPPRSNANFAWLQRALALLTPTGRACVLMPLGSARDSRLKAREITRQLVREDAIEALVMLPAGLFPHVRVSACLWVLNKNKGAAAGSATRDRRDQLLFIDAREMCERVTRGRWLIPDAAIDRMALAMRSWRSQSWESFRGDLGSPGNGWCGTARRSDIEWLDWDLTPSRYVSSATHDADGRERDADVEFDDLILRLSQRMARVRQLDRELLERLGEW